MNSKAKNRAIAILLSCISAVTNSSSAFGATPRPFSIDVQRLAENNGQASYYVDLNPSFSNVIHLPNGLSVDHSATSPPFAELIFQSFQDLKSAFVGQWTLEFLKVTPSSVYETYTIDVADFPESVLYAVPPVITSPADGSTVPSSFTMTWAYPTGVATPPRQATLVEYFGPGNSSGSNRDGSLSSVLSTNISAILSGQLADHLVLHVGSAQADVLAPYVSAVVPQQANSRYDFIITSFFASYSTPVSVSTTVPEPPSSLLLSCSTLSVFVSLRRGERFCLNRI